MLQKVVIIGILLSLLSIHVAASPDDSVTYTYAAPIGVVAAGTGAGVTVCGSGCDLDGDGNNDMPVDNGPYEVPPGHTIVVVTASDAVFGSDVPLTACAYDPVAGLQCGAWTCGTFVLTGLAPGSEVHVFIASLMVQDDTTVCGATTGEVTISSG